MSSHSGNQNNIAEDLVAENDTGARNPLNPTSKLILFAVPLIWTLFQLWYASPLPFSIGIGVFNDTEARAIHLAFAVFLAYTAYPSFKSSPRDRIPAQDWILGIVAALCASYIFLFYRELADRPGLPTQLDLGVAVVGLVLLLEATRRALGPPLMVVALVFILYTFGGQYMPDVIAHKGASLSKGMSHYWLSTEGVYGVALGVSTSMVFMFVLFGSLLEAAGAGNYFIRTAFAGLGHLKGGPAKAAVIASAATGLVSGSSIANVVTTGTFTIPLMKKVGFSAEQAGAVEVASSTNGQLTPPVMGAAAFLMVEYVGVSYVEVIKHAFLPAIISYIALVYIVHLEACKLGMEGIQRRETKTLAQKMLSFTSGIIFMGVLTAATYYGLGWIKVVAGAGTFWVVAVLLVTAYLGLLWYASQVPELEATTDISELPLLKPTAQAGYYFLLPIVVLMWCLTVERLSPSLSAFWATIIMIFIVLTQRQCKGYFRKLSGADFSLKAGWDDLISGLVSGARNMIGIGVATAAAGIIVGTVTLTGIGLVMTEFVEFISGGNLMLILVFTAIISLILGMGLPTTANYIVVSTLMAPVIVNLGAENGLLIPLIAAHLFVFYFGILADDTPPVGLAAFAAAGISGGDPIRTGIQGFTYDIRTAILPFLFVFNTELLMIGIKGPFHLLLVVITAVMAMLLFAAATQGWFLTRSKLWESLALMLIAFTLFRPGYFMDKIYPPHEQLSAANVYEVVEALPNKAQVRLRVLGESLEGASVDKVVMLPVGEQGASGADRLMLSAGLELREENGKMIIDNLVFGGAAEKQKLDFDWEVAGIQVDANRPAKHWFYIPALLFLGLIVFLQRKRTPTVSTSNA